MKGRFLTKDLLQCFKEHLILEERSMVTIEKYCRDASAFISFVGDREVTKEMAIEYKNMLRKNGYAVRSINSMLASINSLFAFLGWHVFRVKALKMQKDIFCPEDRELSKVEYERLVGAAKEKKNDRLCLILQTICGTGIRVGELEYFTVEAVRRGEVNVSCKGKTRAVFIIRKLQKALLRYASEHGIVAGCIFITRSGRPISRTNIWRDMKLLCYMANVEPSKVFPHNLRHLFARVFYSMEKDIAKLADILGHSSINTTRIYIVSTGEEHRRHMERMRLIE
ncbi:MAG: tyrosine-type recombinase/integrase [Clostridia bacterium]|nr:tyrosine-type recombinase/integrase [Clostridia bacterium]